MGFNLSVVELCPLKLTRSFFIIQFSHTCFVVTVDAEAARRLPLGTDAVQASIHDLLNVFAQLTSSVRDMKQVLTLV